MGETGRLVYEEEIQERRAQAELSVNHIGIFVSFLILIITWTTYGVQAWRGVGALWLGIGLVVSLILTLISLVLIDKMLRAEITQFLPIKVYEKGILMPTTSFDRILWRKQPFINYGNLNSIRLIRAHKSDDQDILVAITNQRRNYPKKYDRNSKEAGNILDSIHKAHPRLRIEISE
ncbi:MAG: hypothetical protein JSV09_15645 [Thermoplasmata archaeon]|nr:MAG: hypothetical protein JSV09_15645 [Thermoplasmata archaeon]